MYRRHFIAIAEDISDVVDREGMGIRTHRELVEQLCLSFAEFNNKFDADKFKDASGLTTRLSPSTVKAAA